MDPERFEQWDLSGLGDWVLRRQGSQNPRNPLRGAFKASRALVVGGRLKDTETQRHTTQTANSNPPQLE